MKTSKNLWVQTHNKSRFRPKYPCESVVRFINSSFSLASPAAPARASRTALSSARTQSTSPRHVPSRHSFLPRHRTRLQSTCLPKNQSRPRSALCPSFSSPLPAPPPSAAAVTFTTCVCSTVTTAWPPLKSSITIRVATNRAFFSHTIW